jgi:hypothetical protein
MPRSGCNMEVHCNCTKLRFLRTFCKTIPYYPWETSSECKKTHCSISSRDCRISRMSSRTFAWLRHNFLPLLARGSEFQAKPSVSDLLYHHLQKSCYCWLMHMKMLMHASSLRCWMRCLMRRPWRKQNLQMRQKKMHLPKHKKKRNYRRTKHLPKHQQMQMLRLLKKSRGRQKMRQSQVVRGPSCC